MLKEMEYEKKIIANTNIFNLLIHPSIHSNMEYKQSIPF